MKHSLSRWSVFPAVVLVIVAVRIVGWHPSSVLPGGHANAANPAAQMIAPAAARDDSTGQPFDYFPDHYVNQAKEPAEPIASF